MRHCSIVTVVICTRFAVIGQKHLEILGQLIDIDSFIHSDTKEEFFTRELEEL
jgi:hypothetical protein